MTDPKGNVRDSAIPVPPNHLSEFSPPPWSVVVMCGVIWCVATQLIYRPLEPHPFDVLDFSEFLPLLRRGSSFFERLSFFVEYYAFRGRANLASYVAIILNHQLWGANAVGWQVTRALEFALCSLLLFAVLRRWGAHTVGAATAALLPVCARAAAPLWQRFVASEPIGLILLLGLLWLGTGIQHSKRWRARTIAICGLLVVLLAFKEIYVAFLPAIWAVAYASDATGKWLLRQSSPRLWGLIISTSLTALVCLIPISLIALRAPSGSYASLYGEAGLDVGVALVNYLSILIPFTPVSAELNFGVLLADLSFLILTAFGWRYYRRNAGKHATGLLAFCLLVPVLGVISYLPWPNFQEFYGFFYLIGTAVLVAFAITGFTATGRRGFVIATASSVLPLLFMMTSAQRTAADANARLSMVHELIRTVSREARGDTVVFAVGVEPLRDWFGLGATLSRQAAADGLPFPPVLDLRCAVVRQRLQRATGVMVSLHSQCPPLGNPNRWVVRSFSWFDWARGRIVQDSARADYFNLP